MICEVKELCYKYPGYERVVLDNVSLKIDKGEVLCVLGPNGAGKTTLLNCIFGFLKRDSGDILIKGKPLEEYNEKELANIVAYVPQSHIPTFDYTVKDFVLMGRAPKIGVFSSPSKDDGLLCLKVLEKMGIRQLADKSYMDISGGERQQLMIARAIVQEPELVLFDEPTAHLDYGNQHRVLNMIQQMSQSGYSIIITTHNPDHALMLGGKAAIVAKDGRVIMGCCEDIIREDLLKEIYGIDLKITYLDEIGRKACIVPGL